MIQQIASSWGQQNLEAALAWAKQLPEGAARNSAVSGLGAAWAASDPQAALKFAEALPSGNARRNMYNQIANEMGQNDPAEAIQMVAKLSGDAPKKDEQEQKEKIHGSLLFIRRFWTWHRRW